MTMHLVGPYMTTINYRKHKPAKLSEKKLDQLRVEWRQHNKRMRQIHCHNMQFNTFDDYLDYVQGKAKKVKQTKSVPYEPSKPYQRETKQYPSFGDGVGVATKKEATRYTGDLIVGIATMHKSNAVPVMRGTNEAKDIAKMRR